eukprot:364438-Chlamydomonas_euryale.AAC.3
MLCVTFSHVSLLHVACLCEATYYRHNICVSLTVVRKLPTAACVLACEAAQVAHASATNAAQHVWQLLSTAVLAYSRSLRADGRRPLVDSYRASSCWTAAPAHPWGQSGLFLLKSHRVLPLPWALSCLVVLRRLLGDGQLAGRHVPRLLADCTRKLCVVTDNHHAAGPVLHTRGASRPLKMRRLGRKQGCAAACLHACAQYQRQGRLLLLSRDCLLLSRDVPPEAHNAKVCLSSGAPASTAPSFLLPSRPTPTFMHMYTILPSPPRDPTRLPHLPPLHRLHERAQRFAVE